MSIDFPRLRAVVLDTIDARRLAEFYRRLLGYEYRLGDEPPEAGAPDPRGADWLVLVDVDGEARIAVQQVDQLAKPTWPDPNIPQQLHLDLTVADAASLSEERRRAVELGAEILSDRSSDPDEPLYVFADPAGHPFCIFVSPDHAAP